MILVYVRQSWPKVQAGQQSEESAVLGDWAQLPQDDRLAQYADAVAGIYDNVIVSVFDIESWSRNDIGRVVFEGQPSTRWAHLIGAPNPGRHWGDRGFARSVQCLDTRDVEERYPSLAPSPDADGTQRAVIAGFTLEVDPADPLTAIVVPAAGGRVLIAPSPASGRS